MKELTILDFALGIALLYHWGADGKDVRIVATKQRQSFKPPSGGFFSFEA
jgi:hypothetical protein